jgi:hypothetical protein
MYDTYPWIRIHYVPANCTGLFQPCDVGIQRVLKLAIRRTALQDVINDTTEQLNRGVEPSMVTFEKRLGVVRDRSVRWLVHGYKAINNPELIKKVIPNSFHNFLTHLIYLQAFQLCSTGEKGFNLSYESLTSKEARQLLLERIGTDKEFYRSLKGEDKGEEEEDNDDDNEDDSDNGVIHYDEIDSSKTIDAVIADVIKCTPADCLADIYADEDSGSSSESDAEDKGTGANLDMYTENKLSANNATGRWMEWDSK